EHPVPAKSELPGVVEHTSQRPVDTNEAEATVADELEGAQREDKGLPEMLQHEEETQLDDTGIMQSTGIQAIDFKDYECLYARWRAGRISEGEVVAIGGQVLMELMEAQSILDEEALEDTQQLLGSAMVPTSTTSSTTVVVVENDLQRHMLNGELYVTYEQFAEYAEARLGELTGRAMGSDESDED
ncbi:unnamed protein product, partial [Symbiodinium necroappetens]